MFFAVFAVFEVFKIEFDFDLFGANICEKKRLEMKQKRLHFRTHQR